MESAPSNQDIRSAIPSQAAAAAAEHTGAMSTGAPAKFQHPHDASSWAYTCDTMTGTHRQGLSLQAGARIAKNADQHRPRLFAALLFRSSHGIRFVSQIQQASTTCILAGRLTNISTHHGSAGDEDPR